MYALYTGNKPVKWIVGILYAIEVLMMIIGVFMGVPDIEVDEICLTTNMPWTYLFFLWVYFSMSHGSTLSMMLQRICCCLPSRSFRAYTLQIYSRTQGRMGKQSSTEASCTGRNMGILPSHPYVA